MNGKLLPETWLAKLAIDCFDQISTTNSKVKSKDCLPDGLYPVIDQGQNYISGYINDESKVIKVDSPICIFGDHTRIVKWVTHDFVPGADGTKLLQPKAFIHPRYAYYSLRILNIPDKGYSRHFKYFKELEINLPGRLEQKIIAEKLDTLLAQVDSTKARLEQIPQILKRFRQAVLEEAVSGRLTENWRDASISEKSAEELLVTISKTRKKNLTSGADSLATESKRYLAKIDAHHFNIPDVILPVGWKWTTFLQSMEKVVDCHNKTAPYTEKGIYLIRTPDIRNGIISLKNTKYVNEDTYNFWSKRCPPRSGDIIFTREAPMGEAGIVPENTRLCMGQRMMLLRPMQSYLSNKYVLLNILSISFQARMLSQAIGTGVKHLRVADVESLMYPLPPLPEQHEIVRRVEQLFAYADTIEKQVNSALTRVNNLTQSILAKAFRGELTAQWRAENPDLISGENSAAALLEKIKAERAASGGKKTSRKKA